MEKKYVLKYECTISYAHILQSPPCDCLHGHNGKIQIEIQSPEIDESTGMIVNFHLLKQKCKTYDHKVILNSMFVKKSFPESGIAVFIVEAGNKTYTVPFEDSIILQEREPTVENLAEVIYNNIRELNSSSTLWKIKVTIYEQDYSSVSYGDF